MRQRHITKRRGIPICSLLLNSYYDILFYYNLAKINLKAIINITLDIIGKTVYVAIFVRKVVYCDTILLWVYNPVFPNSRRAIFKKFNYIIHTSAA